MDKVASEAAPAETCLDPELVENLQDRLSRIEGHVRGIERMLDDKEDYEALLVQTAAVKSALNQVIIKLLEGHMETCVADCARRGDVEALERLKTALALVLKNV
jgi:DNA-binding FrmR family transcriptional regulator